MFCQFGRRSALVALLFVSAEICRAESPLLPQDQEIRKAPVVIVGAGLTGLTVAYKLEKAGIGYLLLEKRPRPGGRIQTVHVTQGIHFEAHMEEYWERSPAYTLLKELKLPLSEVGAHSAVRIDGKNFPYQGTTRDEYLRGMFTPQEQAAYVKWSRDSWKIYQRLFQTHFQGKPLPDDLRALTQISFAEFIQRQKLPRKVSEWIRVTLEPEIATEWGQIAALDGIDEMRLFLDTPKGFGERAAHVKGGNSKFVAKLVEQLKPDNLITQAQVTAIYHGAKGVYLRYLFQGAKYRWVYGRAAVVTVPLFNLPNIQFYPPLPKEKQKAIATTRFGGYIKIQLGIAATARPLWRKYETQGDLSVLISGGPAGCIYNVPLGQAGHPKLDRMLTLLIHGKSVKQMLGMSANQMRDHASKHLDKIYPGIAKHITFAEIFVYPKAVAYWPVELGRSRFDKLAATLRTPEGNLHIGGDTTENSHSEGAVQAALRISKALIAKKIQWPAGETKKGK